MDRILQQTYGGNTLYSWGIALLIVVVSLVVIRLFRFFLLKRLKAWSLKTKTRFDDLLVMGLEKFVVPVLTVSMIYFAVTTLKLPAKGEKIAHIAYLVVFTFYILRLISAAVRRLLVRFARRHDDIETDDDVAEQQTGGLMILLNIVIWVIGIVFLIDNLGYDVTTLITGLGIGGIAIALAAQTILGDLFSYFVIFFDRPFEVGDSITIGDQSGTVEKIGIKTTRIRTTNGDQLVCSNTDLTNSRVHNFKRLENRRIAFTLGVTYDTPREQIEEIPQIVKAIIDKHPQVEFDRGHFFRFGASSLDFEFVYHVLHPEYSVYMDVQQAVYLEILSAFQSRDICFAFPTQTIVMETEERGETGPFKRG